MQMRKQIQATAIAIIILLYSEFKVFKALNIPFSSKEESISLHLKKTNQKNLSIFFFKK